MNTASVGQSAVNRRSNSTRITFLIGEDEYETARTLPEFATSELEPRGMRCGIILEDAADKNKFPGLVEALAEAELLVLSMRRRLLPREQLDAVRTHLSAGCPVVAIRTASHGFSLPLRSDPAAMPAGSASWPEFDAQVLGGHYTGHHGQSPKVAMIPGAGAAKSLILEGVDTSQLTGNGSLYQVRPLAGSCNVLLMGSIPGREPEPVAWTNLAGAQSARVFYTSLGHPDDFREPAFNRLMLNGILWALGRESMIHALHY